jgi:hypothetical protein
MDTNFQQKQETSLKENQLEHVIPTSVPTHASGRWATSTRAPVFMLCR